ncbi:hypothetical protein MPLSOD_300003 [Mesorhizobium sp. SOD10]|nr:hypothetical protein MPLSOD_300003 [Mesorhizobium sp. SOD10]
MVDGTGLAIRDNASEKLGVASPRADGWTLRIVDHRRDSSQAHFQAVDTSFVIVRHSGHANP